MQNITTPIVIVVTSSAEMPGLPTAMLVLVIIVAGGGILDGGN